jgi:hypothetical protein
MGTLTSPAPVLDIRLFGGLEIHRDGEMLPLPQSKKTRALLGFHRTRHSVRQSRRDHRIRSLRDCFRHRRRRGIVRAVIDHAVRF